MRFFELAEKLAVAALRARGFNARRTVGGPDGGIDVIDRDRGLVGQVKATRSKVGRPVLQQLLGAATDRGATTIVCFSMGDYTQNARTFAVQNRIALFEIGHDDKIRESNKWAQELSARGAPESATSETEILPSRPAPRPRPPGADDPLPPGESRSAYTYTRGLASERAGNVDDAIWWLKQAATLGNRQARERLRSLLPPPPPPPPAVDLDPSPAHVAYWGAHKLTEEARREAAQTLSSVAGEPRATESRVENLLRAGSDALTKNDLQAARASLTQAKLLGSAAARDLLRQLEERS